MNTKRKTLWGIVFVFSLVLAGVGYAISASPTAFGQTSEPTTRLSITNASSGGWFSSRHYGVVGLNVKGSQSKKIQPKCLFSRSRSSCQYDVAINKEINLVAIPQNRSDKVAWTGCDKTFSVKRSSRSKIMPGRTIYGCKTNASSGSEKKVSVKFGS